MSPLLGGEFVIAFLAARIALWIWRSRADLRALASDPGPPGPGGGRPQQAPRPALRLVHAAPAAERASLPRAA
jgi:hypothetical protein